MVCRKKKNIKVKVTIGIGLSFSDLCHEYSDAAQEFDITQNPISQAVTTGVVILNMLIWYAAQKNFPAV